MKKNNKAKTTTTTTTAGKISENQFYQNKQIN